MDEMMKILTNNKKKVQVERKQLEKTKEHAIDIAKFIWLCVLAVIYVCIICSI